MAEGFLARWARLKRTSDEAPPPADSPNTRLLAETPSEVLEEDAPAAPWAAALTPAETADPAPASPPTEPEPLPPVESLSAESDYRPFLKSSVPDALRLAALRKAWSTDAEIASFRGFADYDWDFNAPGYGKLLPIDDIRKLCDAIFGDQPVAARQEEPPADAPLEPEREADEASLVAEEVAEPALPAEPADVEVEVASSSPEPASLSVDVPPEPVADRRDILDQG